MTVGVTKSGCGDWVAVNVVDSSSVDFSSDSDGTEGAIVDGEAVSGGLMMELLSARMRVAALALILEALGFA